MATHVTSKHTTTNVLTIAASVFRTVQLLETVQDFQNRATFPRPALHDHLHLPPRCLAR